MSNLSRLHDDPDYAARRDRRGRNSLMGEAGEEKRRRAVAVRRGVEVPPELEKAWTKLKRGKRLSNAECAAALGLKLSRRLLDQRAAARAKRKRKQRKTKKAK